MIFAHLRSAIGRARQPMPARDIYEPHRTATPLELMFDLVTVIAVAAAAAELHHALSHHHSLIGIIRFILAFFAIWWAWMNYTWFASAYDNDDLLFRLLTMGLMTGSLTVSAGIKAFFQQNDLSLIVLGFVLMRICMVLLWLRAAKHHPAGRRTALTYAAGITMVQLYWVGLLLNQPLPEFQLALLFVTGALLELAIPAIAERQGNTPWHRHHITERYGLLNLIVLGEMLLAGAGAIASLPQQTFSTADMQATLWLALLPLHAMVLGFSLWWLYFSAEEYLPEQNLPTALTWGYGHLLIYAAGAAAGAGVAVNLDLQLGTILLLPTTACAVIAVPVACYLSGLWLVRDRYLCSNASRFLLPGSAVLIPLLSIGIAQFAGAQAGLSVVTLLTVMTVVLRSLRSGEYILPQSPHLTLTKEGTKQ